MANLSKVYNTGTVSVSNGSTAVTGVGTSWLSTVKTDDVFRRAGSSVRVASVTDDTHLVLAENWPGTTLSGSAYEIAITFDGPEFQQTARKIWSQLSSLLFYVADATSSAYQDFYEQTTNGTNRVRLIAAANLAADVTATLTAAAADLWTRWTSATSSVGASLDFPEATANGTNKVRVVSAAALAADRTFTLPDIDVTFGSKGVSVLATTTNAGAQAAIGVREVLTANRTYYFRSDGSDSNTGLANTSGGAFLTATKAFQVITATLDLAGYTVTVQRGDAVDSTTPIVVTAWVGGGNLVLDGNGRTFNPTSADCIFTSGVFPGSLTVQNGTFRTTTSGSTINHTAVGTLNIGSSVTFGASAGAQVQASGRGAVIGATANYSITGGGNFHWSAIHGAVIQINSRTLTITGTPAFVQFAHVDSGSELEVISDTFSGSATGTRFAVSNGALINTNGGGASYLPGNSAGSGTNYGASPYGLYL